jgi:hypothetical protein
MLYWVVLPFSLMSAWWDMFEDERKRATGG